MNLTLFLPINKPDTFSGLIWLTTWYAPIGMWLSVLLALLAIGSLYPAPRKQT